MQGLQMYLYNCEDCTLLFGVETKFEDQAIVVCPSCQSGDAVEDAGTADVTIVALPEPYEKGEEQDGKQSPETHI